MEIAIDGHMVWLPAAALLGAGVGVIAGMFGIGGGFLLIPLMHALLGVPLPVAVGAGLCTTVANSTGAFLRYRRMGQAELRFDVMLLGGSLLGVDAGIRLLEALERSSTLVMVGGRAMALMPLVLTVGYSGLFLLVAVLLWHQGGGSDLGPPRPGPLARVALPPLVDLPTAGLARISGPLVGLIGLGNGLLGGLLGIGGGVCLIPIMLYGYGFSLRKSAGTGIIVILAAAMLGTVQHARLGNVDLALTAAVMVSSALAAQVGASMTGRLPDVWLRRILSVVLVLTLGALVLKVLG